MDSPEELHIASLVVYSTPQRAQGVALQLAGMPGAEVHGTAGGKFVVTLEAASAAQMVDQVRHIQHTDGVLSAALVYQHADTLDAMNEEISDADGPTGLH
jgi:nitrate reductase NapD